MRVVIVGASGNVGTALSRRLAAEPDVELVGVARRVPRAGAVPVTAWRARDIGREDLTDVLRGADAVVHLAWEIQPSHDLAQLTRTNVEGSARVFEAVVRAGVPALVYASSVGAYSRGPKDRRVDESWPAEGIASSFYARHKAEVERQLDRLEREHPDLRVVRLRPGLIFSREAASEIRRLFIGPLFPSPLARRSLIPFVPRLPRLAFQCVHSADVADAYARAILSDARGPFNVAAEPVLDSERIAQLLDARTLPMPVSAVRSIVAATWHARLQPMPPGWVDLALSVPLMDCTRAQRELGWQPARTADAALLELLDGLREQSGADTPPLAPDAGGPARTGELASGVGSENP
jgi:nucleoside-diphosphate-sugar epimerase